MHLYEHRQRLPGKERRTERVEINMLGTFEVSVDGATTSGRVWTRRSAAALVKILAMAPGQRAHREQVMDILWPDDSPAAAAPKLHKAAHHARNAVARRDAIVLGNDVVQLFPTAEVTVDVAEFDELSRRALADRDADLAMVAIERYRGELLPDDRYEEWAGERRELLRLRHVNLLRLTQQWMAVTELEPADELAHLEAMRHQVADGDSTAALLQFERLRHVLDKELGVTPGSAARELRDQVAAMESSARAPRRLRLAAGEPAGAVDPHVPTVDLVAELAELNRRQAALLTALAGVQPGCDELALAAAAS